MPTDNISKILQLGGNMKRAVPAKQYRFSSIGAFCKRYGAELYAQLLGGLTGIGVVVPSKRQVRKVFAHCLRHSGCAKLKTEIPGDRQFGNEYRPRYIKIHSFLGQYCRARAITSDIEIEWGGLSIN